MLNKEQVLALLRGDVVPALGCTEPVCAETPEQCIRNMAQIGSDGMNNTDQAILKIMMNK